ncbi:MAG TPA: pitrilysin family protein, partial [Bdellovibrionales bacterium]|nr:pitrilysin family protein [Bdellovibrionales bacterium]
MSFTIALAAGIIGLLSLAQPAHASDADRDPFTAIEKVRLENGLTVYLAPNPEAALTAVQVEVDTGFDAETPANWGTAHLLEHVLFRDKQLKDEMSYLQLIKEAGGDANGTTEGRVTTYYGSIPAKKGAWLLETISKLIVRPSITEEYVEKEKGTVELERGRPGPISQALGFNPIDYVKLGYLNNPSFWKSEFGLSSDDRFTLTEEQLSTQRLTRDHLQSFYDAYYYPSNMRLYVAGRFKREDVLGVLETYWNGLAKRDGQKLPPPEQPKLLRDRPYVRRELTEDTPSVYVGTKLWNLTLLEAQIVDSYVEYLSHRLMKELRNKKGQTYTAYGATNVQERSGYAYVHFQTPRENLRENYGQVEELLRAETREGGLTPEQVQDAKKLYLDKYHLHGNEAYAMMYAAKSMMLAERDFGVTASPYQLLKNVTPAEYNDALKKHFE